MEPRTPRLEIDAGLYPAIAARAARLCGTTAVSHLWLDGVRTYAEYPSEPQTAMERAIAQAADEILSGGGKAEAVRAKVEAAPEVKTTTKKK